MLDPYGPITAENSRQRYREMVDQIERERMFDDPDARGPVVHQRVLFGAGNLFVALGRRLQALSSLEGSTAPALRQG